MSDTTQNTHTKGTTMFAEFINDKLGSNKGHGRPVHLEELMMIYTLFYPEEAEAEGLSAHELPVTRLSDKTTEALNPELREQAEDYNKKTIHHSLGNFNLPGAGALVFKERLPEKELYRDPRDPSKPAEVVLPRRGNYYVFANGTQPIDLAKNLDFMVGNVIKYVPRVGRKGLVVKEDLLKAIDYTDKAIAEGTLASSLTSHYWISAKDAKLMLDILPSLRHSSYRLAFYYAYRGWLSLAKMKLHEALLWEVQQGNI